MSKPSLNDPAIFPSDEVLETTLGEAGFAAYCAMRRTLEQSEWNLTAVWNYYNDGKAWLCKVVWKKKTLFWVSVWEGYFKVAFYFTEKHLDVIAALPLTPGILEDFSRTKPVGKLLPMVLSIHSEDQLGDLNVLIKCKIKYLGG
jgi:hypothetical protein